MAGLLGSAKTSGSTVTRLSTLQVQSSISGRAIPLAWGANRLAGNLFWFGDFTSIAEQSTTASGGKGGGSSGGTTSYRYTAVVALGLAEGTATQIGTVWSDQTATTATALGLGLVGGAIDQPVTPYLAAHHPDQALAYPSTAYAFGVLDLGESGAVPNLNFEIYARATYTGGSGQPDASPATVVIDYLTDPVCGAGWPAAWVADLTDYRTYCQAANLTLSPVLTDQEAASSALERWLQLTNSAAVWSDGQLKIRPYADQPVTGNGVTYTPLDAPVYDLDDDDFLAGNEDPVQVTRSSPAESYNQVQVEYCPRENSYNTSTVSASDQAAIDAYGIRLYNPISAHEICDTQAATLAAQLILQRQCYVRNVYKFTLGWQYSLLEPMDIVTITDSVLGLDHIAVRITELEEDQDGNLTVTAEEFPTGVATATLYPKQANAALPAVNYQAPAGPVSAPVIFEPPADLATLLGANGPVVCIAVAGSDATWGGCDVYLSADNATYRRVGSVTNPGRLGVLAAPLPAAADPDTTSTLRVQLVSPAMPLASGTDADADAARTVCYVDGEYLSYAVADLTGASAYTLTYLRRGQFGSAAGNHAQGAQFARLDSTLYQYALPDEYVGKTLWLKFVSFNQFGGGREALDAVATYSYSPTGAGSWIAAPASIDAASEVRMAVDGTHVSTLVVAWSASAGPKLIGYEVQYRIHGAEAWSGLQLGADTTSWMMAGAVEGAVYDAQVRALSALGTFSSWTATSSLPVVTKTAPPPAPTGLTAAGGYRQISLAWTASAEADVTMYEIWETQVDDQSRSYRLSENPGTSYIRTGLGLSDQRWYWIRAVDSSGNVSSWCPAGPNAGVTATSYPIDAADLIGQINMDLIAPGAIDATRLANSVLSAAPTIVTALPDPASWTGSTSVVYGGALYTLAKGKWISTVAAANVTGVLPAAALPAGAVGLTNLAAGLTAVQTVATLPAAAGWAGSSVIFCQADGQIYRLVSGAWTSSITAADIPAGALDVTKFASGLSVPAIVSALPASGTEGQLATLTTDGQLYRYHAGAWTAAVPAASITGVLPAAALPAGAIGLTNLASGLTAVQTVATLPAATGWTGSSVIFCQADGQIYRLVSGAWTSSVTGADIPAGALDVTKFASGLSVPAIVSALPASGTEGQLAVLSTDGKLYRYHGGVWTRAVDGADLIANSIAAASIVAGAVGATQLAASAVTATKLAAGSVTTAAIAAGAVTAGTIAAGAVNTVQLAANAVTAIQIAAGAVTATALAAGSITATALAAGAVTAASIAANAITAASIAAGAVGATQIAAAAITASKLLVADTTNLLNDPTFSDASYWTYLNGAYNQQGTSMAAALGVGGCLIVPTSSTLLVQAHTQFISVEAGTVYRLTMTTTYGGGAAVPINMGLNVFDTTKVQVAGVNIISMATAAPGLGSAQWTAPAGAAYVQVVLFCTAGTSPTGAYWAVGAPRLERAATGSLIVDGAITATKLAAGSVTTAAIAAGAITAGTIAAGAVNTVQLAANAVTAIQIAAGAVAATALAAGSVTATALAAGAVTAASIAANAITAASIAAGAVGATQIAAGAITASKLTVADTTNLLNDPTFSDTAYWTYLNGAYNQQGTSMAAALGVGGCLIVPTSSTLLVQAHTQLISVEAGTVYRLTMTSTYGSGAAVPINMGLNVFDTTKVQVAGVNLVSMTTAAPGLGSAQWTAPAGAAYVQVVLFCTPGTSPTNAYWAVGAPRLERAATGSLIVDGAITATKLAAGSVTTNALLAGSVTADKIAANSITAVQLATSILYGGVIYLGGTNVVLNGASSVITVSDSTRVRAAMGLIGGTYGLAAWDANGNVIFGTAGLGPNTVNSANVVVGANTTVATAVGSSLSVGVNYGAALVSSVAVTLSGRGALIVGGFSAASGDGFVLTVCLDSAANVVASTSSSSSVQAVTTASGSHTLLVYVTSVGANGSYTQITAPFVSVVDHLR